MNAHPESPAIQWLYWHGLIIWGIGAAGLLFILGLALGGSKRNPGSKGCS